MDTPVPTLDRDRRRVLAIALVLLSLLCTAAAVIVAREPHTVGSGAGLFAGGAAVFALSLGLLYWRRCPLAVPAALTIACTGGLILVRVVTVLGSEAVRSGELSAFHPIFAYVPTYFALLAVLLPPRLSVPGALGFWLLIALLTTALTRGLDTRQVEALPSLLLFVWLAYPLLIALIAGAMRIVARIQAEAIESRMNLAHARSELAQANRELERRIAQRTAELESQRAALAAVLDNVGKGIIACDAQGRVTLVNPAARTILGEPPPDRHIHTWCEQLSARHPPGVEQAPMPFEVALRGEQVRNSELLILAADGTVRNLSVNAGPLPDGGIVITVRDDTETVQQREALLQSNAALEQFAYAISHDLQAPLRTVAGFSRLLARSKADALDADGREYLDFIVDGCATMAAMIDGVLQISRLRARALKRQRVDPREAAATVLDQLRSEAGFAEATSELGEMPPVDADPDLLVLLFQNLIGNALKFSDGPAQITVEGRRDGNWVILEVRDRGIGFEPSQAEALFSLFRRGVDPSQRPGHGIGLATCKLIVERLDGRIEAMSDGPGRGACLRVTLPAAG